MFLHTDVGKDRLHDRQPSGINALAHFTIDLGLHRIDQVWRLRVDRNGEVPARGRGLAQTARFDRTGSAILNAGMIHIIGSIAVDLVVRMTGQFFSLRAEINLLAGVKRKIRSVERTRLRACALPAVDAILEAFLIRKVRITFAEVDVGDVGVDLFILAHIQTVERMIVAIGGELLSLKIGFILANRCQILFRIFQHRSEIFVILASECFSSKNDLMLGIDQRLGIVALNDAVGGGHLDRFIVNHIALDFFALAAVLRLLLLQELVQAFDLDLEAPLAFFCRSISTSGCWSACACSAMTCCSFSCNLSCLCLSSSNVPLHSLETFAESLTPSRLKCVPPSRPISSHTSRMLPKIFWISLCIEDDELSDRAVIGSIAIRECNENNVFLAGAFDLSRTDHALGVRQQNNLEQDLGMNGGCAGLVVVVARIEYR